MPFQSGGDGTRGSSLYFTKKPLKEVMNEVVKEKARQTRPGLIFETSISASTIYHTTQ